MNRFSLVLVILLSVCTKMYSSDSLQVRRYYLNTIGKALDKMKEDMPYSAIDILETLKDTSKLDSHGYNVLMLAYNLVNKDNEAIQLYTEWEKNDSLVKESTIRERMSMYSGVSLAYSHVAQFEESILMMERYIEALKEIDDKNNLVLAYALMGEIYEKFGDVRKALKYTNDAIRLKMYVNKISITDILNEKIYNKQLADLFLAAAKLEGKMIDYKEMQRDLIFSCACGNDKVNDMLNMFNLKYKKGLKSLKKEFIHHKFRPFE